MATVEGSGLLPDFLMGCATWPVITPKIIPEGDGELYADFSPSVVLDHIHPHALSPEETWVENTRPGL